MAAEDSAVIGRRDFLRLGALFMPAAALAPRRAYSFLWAPLPTEPLPPFDDFSAIYEALVREMAIATQIPERVLRGETPIGTTIRVSARVTHGALLNYRHILEART
jgi:hypothetical protein